MKINSKSFDYIFFGNATSDLKILASIPIYKWQLLIIKYVFIYLLWKIIGKVQGKKSLIFRHDYQSMHTGIVPNNFKPKIALY